MVKISGKQAFSSFCKTLGDEIILNWCQELGITHGGAQAAPTTDIGEKMRWTRTFPDCGKKS
ncbi:MAG: hypothetical protein RLZZ338_274 [Cyanobacteriota bacterium]